MKQQNLQNTLNKHKQEKRNYIGGISYHYRCYHNLSHDNDKLSIWGKWTHNKGTRSKENVRNRRSARKVRNGNRNSDN